MKTFPDRKERDPNRPLLTGLPAHREKPHRTFGALGRIKVLTYEQIVSYASNSKAGQPSNLLQERLKEAASAAMKVENNDMTAPAADEFMERFETEEKIELKEDDGSGNLVLSDNNDSSLVI